jgi:hypothetical protein
VRSPDSVPQLALQHVSELPEATWPDNVPGPQQLHLDMTPRWRLLYDRSHEPEEPLRVYAEPAGHPFCTFVA